MSSAVAISTGYRTYGEAPHSPAQAWPEHLFSPSCLSASANPAYEGGRQALHSCVLDAEQYGLAARSLRDPATRPDQTVASGRTWTATLGGRVWQMTTAHLWPVE